jgi:hypothetical protein
MIARFSLLVLLAAAPLASAQTVTLTPFPADGTFDTFTSIVMDMTIGVEPTELTPETMEAAAQKQEVTNTAERYGTLTIESVAGGHALRLVEDRVVVEAVSPLMPAPMRYDSDSPDGANPQLAAAGIAIGVPMELSTTGGELTLTNRDAYLDALVGDVPDEETRALQRSMLESTLVDAQVAALAGMQALLPTEAVSVGDTWRIAIPTALSGVEGQMTGEMTVTSIDGDVVRFSGPVEMSGTISQAGFSGRLSGSGTSENTFNVRTGASESTSVMTLSALAPLPAEAGMDGDIAITMEATTISRQTPR